MTEGSDSGEDIKSRQSDLGEIREHIGRLERSRRWERIAALVALLLIIGGVWLADQSGDHRQTVQAERFVLTDENGKARGSLNMQKNLPQLVLRDVNGVSRIVLEVESNGDPVIWLGDEQEDGRARISLAGGRYPYIELVDPNTSEPKISMGITQRGEAFLNVYDYEKNEYWKALSAER